MDIMTNRTCSTCRHWLCLAPYAPFKVGECREDQRPVPHGEDYGCGKHQPRQIEKLKGGDRPEPDGTVQHVSREESDGRPATAAPSSKSAEGPYRVKAQGVGWRVIGGPGANFSGSWSSKRYAQNEADALNAVWAAGRAAERQVAPRKMDDNMRAAVHKANSPRPRHYEEDYAIALAAAPKMTK